MMQKWIQNKKPNGTKAGEQKQSILVATKYGDRET